MSTASRPERERHAVFNPSCGHHHEAEVWLDATGYPIARFLDSCADTFDRAEHHLAEMFAHGSEALAIALAANDWHGAERAIESVLHRNDGS